jgi:hypothetical protein
VDGGPNYYAQFGNPLPSSPDFFPLSTWGSYNHFQPEIDEDKAVGLNGYTWFADAQNIANANANGLWVVQDYAHDGNVGPETRGWLLGDEIDMTQGPSACPSVMNANKATIENPGGRLYYSNYGKGVIFWETDAEAACFVNYDDVNSADIYWFSDGNVCSSLSEGPAFYGLSRPLTTAECRRASNYGDVVQDMRRLDALNGSPRHPIWAFVEVAHWSSNGRQPLPAESRAAVWHSLIAGARGIVYFQHSFYGPCTTHHVLRENGCYQPMIETVTSVNALIKSIAPALNGPKLTSGFSANANVRAVAKWDGSRFYVLAGSAENASTTGSFAIPCVADATATVLGESRGVPVVAGAWSDAFAGGNAVHIYRIDGRLDLRAELDGDLHADAPPRDLPLHRPQPSSRGAVPATGSLALEQLSRDRRLGPAAGVPRRRLGSREVRQRPSPGSAALRRVRRRRHRRRGSPGRVQGPGP